MKTVKSGKELGAVLRQIREQTEDDFVDILTKLTADAWRMLITRTAVDTGYARAKWQISVDTVPSDEGHVGKRIPGRKPKSGPVYATPSQPKYKIRAGSIIILYNNTEYIVHLEYGTPHMSPQPMVTPTLIELTALANRLCDKLSNKKVKE